MSRSRSNKITKQEMSQPSAYGGDPRRPSPKKPYEVLRDMYRSDPADSGDDGRSR